MQDLVRPYRVGMSCAFCHVGPSPINPPARPEKPLGEPRLQHRRAVLLGRPHLLLEHPAADRDDLRRAQRGQPPLPAVPHQPAGRAGHLAGLHRLHEQPAHDERGLRGDRRASSSRRSTGAERCTATSATTSSPRTIRRPPRSLALRTPSVRARRYSMRVLKDGADSAWARSARSTASISTSACSARSGSCISAPSSAGRRSRRSGSPMRSKQLGLLAGDRGADTADMAIFFLVTARADHLADAPGGAGIPRTVRDPGQGWSAARSSSRDNCAACHSSKQPEPIADSGVDAGHLRGRRQRAALSRMLGSLLGLDPDRRFKDAMVKLVTATRCRRPGTFLDGNYLSTERRVPVDLLETNACTAIATNGLCGDIWDNFTSSTYKSLPPPGRSPSMIRSRAALRSSSRRGRAGAMSGRRRWSASGPPHPTCRTTRWAIGLRPTPHMTAGTPRARQADIPMAEP